MSNRPQSSRQNEDEIDLHKLLGILVDGRWWIIGCTTLFLLISIFYTMMATPIYKASALLQVERKASGSALLGDMANILGTEQSDSLAEIELLTSRMVIGKTVDDLHLDNHVSPVFFPVVGRGISQLLGKSMPELVLERFDVPGQLIDTPFLLTVTDNSHFTITINGFVLEGMPGQVIAHNGIRILISSLRADVGQQFILSKRTKLDVVSEVQKALQVSEKGKNSGILLLTLEGENKENIRRVLDSISNNYLMQNVKRRSEEAEKSLDFLTENMPKLSEDLERAENELNTYRQKNESVDLSLEAKSALETMVDIEKQLNELTFREVEMQQRYTRQHPAYVALLEQRQTLLNTKKAINESIKKLPQVQQGILRLTRDVNVGQEIFVQLLNKLQELKVMKAGTIGNVRIIDVAAVESQPVKPKKALIVVLGVIAGAMLAVGFVLLRATFHRGVESSEQLEELGVSVYATIPISPQQLEITKLLQRRKNLSLTESLLASKNPADLAIESLRNLRTTIHFAMLEAKNNILLISGSGPEIGKSFISTNFSAILAMGGKKVLLIDADLRRGKLNKIFSHERNNGLSAYLSGQLSLEALVVPTGFEGMDVISTGIYPPNPAELLMLPRFKELLEWASQHYDFVVIDSPPILAVTDAAIIGQHVGTTLLIARYAKTTAAEVDVSIRRFEQSGVNIKGVLLNGIEKRSGNYYRYNYIYDYRKDKSVPTPTK